MIFPSLSVGDAALAKDRALFYLNGNFFGWGAGVKCHGFMLSCSQFAVSTSYSTLLSVAPSSDGDQQPSLVSAVNGGELDVTVEDTLAKKILLRAFGLKLDACLFSHPSNSWALEALEFTCRHIEKFDG